MEIEETAMKRHIALTATGTIAVIYLLAAPCFRDDASAARPPHAVDPALLPASPADSRPVPADYDNDDVTDMALKAHSGIWYIDLGANGFGGRWDMAYTGYGDDTAVPVPADYDNDGAADLSVKDAAGIWGIDHAADGFGYWNLLLSGYGDDAAVPVPADYDGDGMADLSVKSPAGDWYINYSADGFANGWDVAYAGYGNSAAVPVPADYDGDLHADLAVKDAAGCWYIDYWSDGFGGWNEIRCGYGDASAVPVPADYDGDGWADLSVKGDDGNWYVDYAAGGFGGWNAIYSGYGGNSAIAVPGDYDHDGALDLSVYATDSGYWYIDFAANGFVGWDTWIDNPGRLIADTTRPYIVSTTIYGEGGLPVSQLVVGERYTVDVVVHAGSGTDNACGVEINEALGIPSSLKLVNRFGSTYVADVSEGGSVVETHRRFALTCTQPGNFPLGFQLRSVPPYYFGSEVFNPDYGIRVVCVSPPQTALSGRVTQRIQNAQGVFVSGPPIEGATVSLVSSGGITTTTDSQGRWRFPVYGGPGVAVRITKPGYSEVNVVNLTVPLSGLLVNTSMEQAFTALPDGIDYEMYIDYSRGRTVLHVVGVSPASRAVQIGKSGFDPAGPCNPACTGSTQCPAFETLQDVGNSLDALVIMNGTWWNLCNGNPFGYVYSLGPLDSEVWCDNRGGSTTDCSNSNVYFAEGAGTTGLYPAGTSPMLTITGNTFSIVESNANFLEAPSSQWSQVGNPTYPIWDVSPRDGQSDVEYALQIPNPPLLRDGAVIAGGHFVYDLYGNYDYAFARTSVGVDPTGKLFLVVADGEGVHGGNGATGNQLAHFYRDVLGASRAMGLDSGLSTELRIRTAAGLYRVNTITGEDAGIQLDPYTEVFQETAGAVGSVGYYLAVTDDAVTAAPAPDAAQAFAVRVRPTAGSSSFQFELTLPEAGAAELRLYDVSGRQVAVAFQGDLSSGSHTIPWHGTNDRGAALASGVYYYQFRAGSSRAVGSVVVFR